MKKLFITVIIMTALVALATTGGNQEEEGKMERLMDAAMPVPPPGFSDGNYVKPSEEELREKLTKLEYKVTQKDGTERAFSNTFWDDKRKGIYVDIVSGEPLFSSTDKYKSGTGWPSFTRPLEEGNVMNLTDRGFGMTRIEVRSFYSDSHLGHVFNDGPEPTGLRYCINSASLRFVPFEELEELGYGQYISLFE